MNEKWFAFSISEVEKKLKTSAASGLSRKAARSAWYRTFSKIQPLFIRKTKPAGKMIGEILSDFALIIMLLSAVFAVLFAEHLMGITVLLICFVNIIISSVIYFRSQRTMERMDMYFMPTAKVIRGGKLYRVGFENVVSGDVIIVQKGDIVCGDARLVTSDNLTVIMRAGKSKAITLKKQAHGVVAENENNPAKMTNIIHAGSVIKEGSGRAIVFATGMYTYLGALTGGIKEAYNDNVPNELKKMKLICSQISLISMLCILPFSVVSLLLSHLNGGSATLSAAFLTALSLCASSMTQLYCTICKLFFVKKIKDVSVAENSTVIRTTDAFENLADIDYLFMLDGSALTDGILHFDVAFTAEGDVREFVNYNGTVASLFELAALYNSAESSAITIGINLPDRYKVGMDEFVSRGRCDTKALKIKYPIKSYMQGTPSDPTDKIHYTQSGKNMLLCVSATDKILSTCSYALISGKVQALTDIGIDRLKHTCNVHTSQGKSILLFTLTTFENGYENSNKIFVGAVVLREGVDRSAVSSILRLKQKGIKVVSFVGGDKPKDIPEIPLEIQRGVKAYKDSFVTHQLPISCKFGEIDTYIGLEEKDIEGLIDFAQNNKHKVCVLGFSDYAEEVIAKSDVFMTCSPAINVFSAKSEEELYTLEMAGAGTSAACTQTVKSAADVIIQRPNGKTGGIRSLYAVFSAAEIAYRNLYTYFRYMLCAQVIRLMIVALPMAYGKPILDARHVLLCSFVIDIIIMLMLALDRKAVGGANDDKEAYRIKPLRKHFADNRILMLSATVASVIAIFLPIVMDISGIFGPYLYQVEYLLSAILWLHITLAFYIRYRTVKNVRLALKNRYLTGLLVGCACFILVVTVFRPIGLLFNFISNPIVYFLFSFVPALSFGIIYELAPKIIRLIRK